MAKAQVGLQLYTLRDQTEKDLLGTLGKVAEIGYKAVEFAGFFGHSSTEVKRALADNGLTAPSAHVPLNIDEPEKLEPDLQRQIEFAQEIGLQYVVTPWYPMPEQPNEEDLAKFIGVVERACELVTSAGLKYGYHNHDFEFKQVGGKTIMDHLLERIPAERMIAEFDLGWIHVAGYKPVDYINKYAGRVPLAHFKDFGNGRRDTEIGRGTVDFESVLKVADEAGIQYIIVEQEEFASSSLESAAICLEFFKERGLA
ncbi:sugar phosphate isomerase/epimerase family protein [Paenibacillus tarimensis]|uniref:sugar phosphate isomerase/epimerase family protein n=1 Tax=Paenibacillus tarimensis TaxID=416012 RepID=UPI001F2AF911|nr:sugar phosphate isomerase/epimerase [Paenibacillus tarimensis]MCF2945664.1 sugar phosphate isomerase/epimerase [Paenibacillus tarimensis]